MDFFETLLNSGLVVFMAVYALCAVIRQIPKIPNWIIPLVALVLGVGIGAFILGVDAKSLIMGGLAGWAATGGNQTLKKLLLAKAGIKEDDSDEGEG